MRLTNSTRAFLLLATFAISQGSKADEFIAAGRPAQLTVRKAGARAVRVSLFPVEQAGELPFCPALAEQQPSEPVIKLTSLDDVVHAKVGQLLVEVKPNPLRVSVRNKVGKLIQELTFHEDEEETSVTFRIDDAPILGMGEGGRQPGRGWRDEPIEFDRRGRKFEMRPRWQSNAYGSRNPVPLLIGTSGWALFVASPWVHVDLSDNQRGTFIPWQPPEEQPAEGRRGRADRTAQLQGRPPVESIVPGAFDIFVFDAQQPAEFMRDLSALTGPAVMPPKWSLGYMQSHRTLEDEDQLLEIVDTFREKRIPLDAVIYLGTGFCPRGWNLEQPSFIFNPDVFKREPKSVIDDLHERDVKVIVHVVPFGRERLPTLHGTVPAQPDETLDVSHIQNYWALHGGLIDAGIDAFWPDEGDWFNLFERVKRHQLYYEGPLSSRPNVRPWSLHRNGYLGVARYGGWVWSGDTDSSWKTLEGQVAVGINHSLSLSPYWGSDIGGFYPNEELTGELYARWFQFGAFCPSFRSHGRTWWTRLPWGWGLSEMGPQENGRNNPSTSELNNAAIEPVCRTYAELRYQLMPYTYTLARQAHDSGLPLMRAMWLHYPNDEQARGLATQYMWGRDLLIAPVLTKDAARREVYLPEGIWYDWWTNEHHHGSETITRDVDLATMPIYVRAGAIVPVDPIRQSTAEDTDEPMTLKVFRGADGEFALYEDDGISLDYLNGAGNWTQLTWDDGQQQLVIEPKEPAGDTTKRSYRVELSPEGTTRTIEYAGERTVVSFAEAN